MTAGSHRFPPMEEVVDAGSLAGFRFLGLNSPLSNGGRQIMNGGNLQLQINELSTGNPSPRMNSKAFVR